MSKVDHVKSLVKQFEDAVTRCSNEMDCGTDYREYVKAEKALDSTRKALLDAIDDLVKK